MYSSIPTTKITLYLYPIYNFGSTITMSEQLSTKPSLKDSVVGRLSPHDSSAEGFLAKLGVISAGWLGGLTISDLLTFASLVYVCLNIWVLLRDKVFKKRTDKPTDVSSGE